MAQTPQVPRPPRAEQRPQERVHHGDVFVDPYEWLRDGKDPDVLAHLTAENVWTDQVTAHLKPLADELFEDVRVRTQETDVSVPTYHRHTDGSAYWYYRRTRQGAEYSIHCRVPATSHLNPPRPAEELPGEEILLDGNIEAEGQEFFSVGALHVSPNGKLLAWSADFAGDERYELQIREIATGRQIGATVSDIGSGVAWAGDQHVFYPRVDDAWRPCEVWRHAVGESRADELVHTEHDERFWLSVDSSSDLAWVVITCGSKITTEVRLIPAADPTRTPQVVQPRQVGLEYLVEPAGDEFLILHNGTSPDFQIDRVPVPEKLPQIGSVAPREQWQEFLPPQPGVRWTDVEAYLTHVVVERRKGGLSGVEIYARDGRPVDFEWGEPNVGTMTTTSAADYDSPVTRVAYTSMVTPAQVLEVELETGAVTVLKQTPVLDHPRHGAYDPSDYVEETLWATAEDGTRIPLSVVRRSDVSLDGTAPCLLYGYGAYEISIDPGFSMFQLSLLDRGFVYAIAHIRGGGELGREWYEQGKLLRKPNTFSDFVACADKLIADGYTSPERLAAQGGSAGGLLMGAVANLAPDRFAAIHAAVPFVDALTTILDPELPLTVTEWDEWGDPLHDAEVYACMKGYSPYENVTERRYPAILATTSLNDTRVFFVEPTKWIAALRDKALNEPEEILYKCELVAGHGGVSGRYRSWHEAAFEFAWIIDRVGRG